MSDTSLMPGLIVRGIVVCCAYPEFLAPVQSHGGYCDMTDELARLTERLRARG